MASVSAPSTGPVIVKDCVLPRASFLAERVAAGIAWKVSLGEAWTGSPTGWGRGCSCATFDVYHGFESDLAHFHVCSSAAALDVVPCPGFDGAGF